jgi:hypothetical protein
MQCAEKVWYPTAVLAEKARRELIVRAKDKRAAKRLVVYNCRDCGKFHIGHVRPAFNKPAKEYPPSARQRRAGKRIEKTNAKNNRRALEQIGYYFDLATAARRAKESVDELNDALALANHLADRYFPAPIHNPKTR